MENIYTLFKCLNSKCQIGDAAAGLGLQFLHMPEGPFSHDAGHIMYIHAYVQCSFVYRRVIYRKGVCI